MDTANSNIIGLDRRFDTNHLAIQMRLDTNSLLEKIEIFLRGGKMVYAYDSEDKLQGNYVSNGEAKCNNKGIQTLLNWIAGTINPQVVQGNFSLDMKSNISTAYDNFIKEYNIELANMVVLNVYDWEMKEEDMNGVINFIMLLIIPFMTRLIDNKERESYSDTIKTVESSKYESGRSMFGLGGN